MWCHLFYKEAKSAGIKPIIGCEVYVTTGSRFDKDASRQERLKHLILLAETMEGYQNLTKIVSRGFTEGFTANLVSITHLLKEHSKGIIALSACIQGEIPQCVLQDNPEGAKRALETYLDIYGKDNFF